MVKKETVTQSIYEENKERIGACRFCGQLCRISEEQYQDYTANPANSDADPEDILNWIATMNCTCEDGRAEQAQQISKDETFDNIDKLFKEDHPEIAELLKSAAVLMYNQKMVKLSIQIGKYTKGTITKNSKGIVQVKRIYTKTDTLES